MTISSVRLGYRTLKTSLAVMICILLFHLLDRPTPMIASLAAVFSMREDVTKSISFGSSRILGNLMGGLLGVFYFYLYAYFNYNFLVELLAIPVLLTILITSADAINLNKAIIGASATFLIIVMTIPEYQTIGYAIDRVVDTLIGTCIALLVNRFVKPPEPLEISASKEAKLQKQLDEQAKQLAQLKKENDDLKNSLND